jgi:hypothetical protein
MKKVETLIYNFSGFNQDTVFTCAMDDVVEYDLQESSLGIASEDLSPLNLDYTIAMDSICREYLVQLGGILGARFASEYEEKVDYFKAYLPSIASAKRLIEKAFKLEEYKTLVIDATTYRTGYMPFYEYKDYYNKNKVLNNPSILGLVLEALVMDSDYENHEGDHFASLERSVLDHAEVYVPITVGGVLIN